MANSPPLALLAGGLATRMRPLTEKVPKSMLEVAGEPFIAHQLRLLKRENITEIVICAGFLVEQIKDFVGDGGAFGVSVRYSVDAPTLLGTGGSIKKALPLLGDTFFIMYGDSYLDTDFASIYHAFQSTPLPALMTVLHNKDQWDSSNIVFADGKVQTYDKKNKIPAMEYVDYGLGLVDASIFTPYPENTVFDLAELYGGLVDKRQMAGYEVKTRFYEIGSPKGLDETSVYIRAQQKEGAITA